MWISFLPKNRIFIDRVRNVGIMPRRMRSHGALPAPASGHAAFPMMSASFILIWYMIKWILKFPLARRGTIFDRYLVRMEELIKACGLWNRLWKIYRPEPINVDMPEYRWQSKDDISNRIESLIFHFKTVTEGTGANRLPGEIYSAVEGQRRVGFLFGERWERQTYKCRVRPPCFPLTAAMPKMVKARS